MAAKATPSSREHWDKLIRLIELAKKSRTLSNTMRHGKPSEVVAALRDQVGLSGEEVAMILDDLELIADRGSVRWWSPLG